MTNGRSLGLLSVIVLLLPAQVWAKDVRSAKLCGACHGQIRREWETSAMARSWKNPVFQAFLADAKAALGEQAARSCIACHAPMASVGGDFKVESPISAEGVTCNFCHNVSAVDPSPKPASYTFDSTDPDLMRGPYKDADPGKAHGFAYSEIHTKSDFCAACHSFAHPESGVMIETTYERWKTSQAAASGRRCQDCHMPAYAGQAAPNISKNKREKVYSHAFGGAHAPAMIDSAASLSASLEGGRLKLTVRNRKPGHALPGGGGGMRVITLAVRFTGQSGESLSTTQVQSYGIQYADAKGLSPVPKWLAKTIVRRNEIPPDSSVVEWCDMPPKAKRAVATLTYYFIDPAYLPGLRSRQVDLSRHQPVILAKAERNLR